MLIVKVLGLAKRSF